MQLLAPVRRYLTNRHISVPEDWLNACIDWALSEYPEHNVPFILEKVYHEWLHADLSELASSCLPLEVQELASTTISGHFPLQINSVRDISEPAYSQLLKVDGVDNENASVSATQYSKTEWERKAERMLILELTDGTTVVEGMEYRPAPSLNVNLSPGTKVMVYGSVKVRRGILFLTQQNITVLGGKVMTLQETNNQRNTLKAALSTAVPNADTWVEHGGNADNDTWIDSHVQPQACSSVSGLGGGGGGGGGMRAQTCSLGNTAPPHDDDQELDFFDDAVFEHEFDQDLMPEDESIQDHVAESELDENVAFENGIEEDLDESARDPVAENEFDQNISLENEFDEDLDQFMSQM